MASLAIPITKLRDDAVIPSYAYPGDAGVDLRAVESVSLAPFERALVPTGLAIAIPEGYAGFVQPRSGDRIAQLVIQKVENVEWSVVDALDETERGCGGFGSSGVQ